MIKGGHAGYPGAELKKLLDDKERGAHVVATTTIDGDVCKKIGFPIIHFSPPLYV
jgi:hypothetical protein